MTLAISAPTQIVKRNGTVVAFDYDKITNAVARCMRSVGQAEESGYSVADKVVNVLGLKETIPTVEQVQDIVELILQSEGYYEAAKHYIIYRHEHAKARTEQTIPQDIRDAFQADTQYFPTSLQQFQFLDKYSRWNYELGHRETWVETVDRATAFLHELGSQYADLGSSFYQTLRGAMLRMEVMPSMRLLAMAGVPAQRDNTVIYNCAYLPVDSLESFVENMIISMAGCGVGYSVESQYVRQLPIIPYQNTNNTVDYVIEDSAEGWADALRFGVAQWMMYGGDARFHYDDIRPAGSVLRTKGGRSSGPGPLRILLDNIKRRILAHQGRQLTTLAAHDIMCDIADAVVSGGVRRTAMIALFDEDDMNMLMCKYGDFEQTNPQRWNANNSMVWTDTINMTQKQFMDRFKMMLDSGRGEPGIFSRDNTNRLLPERRKLSNDKVVLGTNPCFAAGTLIHTRTGHYHIESLIGKTVDIWNGTDWQTVDNFRVTARNQELLKITLHDGSEIRCTENHRFILRYGTIKEAKDLVVGARLKASTTPETHGIIHENGAYIKGILLAEGTSQLGRPMLNLYEPKFMCANRIIASGQEILAGEVRTNAITEMTFIDDNFGRKSLSGLSCRKNALIDWTTTYRKHLPDRVFAWDYASKLEFIAGYFDGDGTAQDSARNGFKYQLSSISHTLLLDVQALLKTIGVKSKIAISKYADIVDFNDGYGEYQAKDCWRLSINQPNAISLAEQVRFSRLTSFANKIVKNLHEDNSNIIAKIESDGLAEEVYCCTVEGSHSLALTQGIHVMNCGEILLRPRQFCNLSIAVARADDTLQTMQRKVMLAAQIGTLQSLATYFPQLSDEWKRNCEQERLLGVDITGQMDVQHLFDAESFTQLKDIVVQTNKVLAQTLGINQSAATTCNKPSGNSSQLLDCASGIHARWAPYYIRNVRVSATSPLCKVLRDASVPMEPENGQPRNDPHTWVVSFPVKAPTGAITRNDRSAVQQCEWWLLNKEYWTEHNPSVTITYTENEVLDLTKWVWDHRTQIGGMAFLPSFDAKYDQLPYIEITEEEYTARIAAFPSQIDWARIWLYEHEDMTKAAQELACSAGYCELP